MSDDYTRVAAANDYPVELWRDEAARDIVTWANLRDTCAGIAAEAGRKLVTGHLNHQEERYWEFAREVELEGDGWMLLPSSEDEADAVRCRLTCWTVPQ